MRLGTLLLCSGAVAARGSEAGTARQPIEAPRRSGEAFRRLQASRPLQAQELEERLATFWPAARSRAGPRRLFAEPTEVEQVHLGLGGPGEVVVTFLTQSRGVPSEVSFAEESSWISWQTATGEVSTYSLYVCPSNGMLKTPFLGESPALPVKELAALVNTSAFMPETSEPYFKLDTIDQAWKEISDGCVNYKNPMGYVQSPYIHTVVLKDIKPRTSYKYRAGQAKRDFKFTTPPAAGTSDPNTPFRFGVWADVGVTNVSLAVVKELLSYSPELVLLVGDYSYADGWMPRWDLFGRMAEPLMSGVATLGVPGNHEMASGRTQARDWMMRYPAPFRPAGSESPLWYSYEAGLVHFLCLVGNYAPTGVDSPQYQFAKQDLQSVNRTRTPWLVVMFHTPWYNSNDHHYQEAYKAKQDMEDMLFFHGVDFVFNGHLHSYERTHQVYKDQVNRCGPMHIVIGDAGNYEGPALPWRQPQPAWSAFRESSFGAGMLTVHNGTHAEWEWRRAACVHRAYSQEYTPYYVWDGVSGPEAGPQCATSGDESNQRFETSDSVAVVRDPTACPSRLEGSGRGWPARAPSPAPAPAAAAAAARRLASASRGPADAAAEDPPPPRPLTPGAADAGSMLPAGVTRTPPRPPFSRPLTQQEALHLASSAHGTGTAARRLLAEDPVQQVHVGLGGPGEAVVTFLSWVRGLPSEVLFSEGPDGELAEGQATVAEGEVSTYTTFICPTGSKLHHPRMGETVVVPDADLAKLVNTSAFLPSTSASYTYLATASQAWDHLQQKCIVYKNPMAYHQAPFIHTAILRGLKPRTSYSYRPKASSRRFQFSTPPAAGPVEEGKPFKIGVWADVGITNVSWTVMQQVKAANPDLVLTVGDYSYADGWSVRWDVFGTLMEPLMSAVPGLGVPGNHEIEVGRYQGVDWTFRYPMPYREAGSESPFFYSYDSGPVHILGLTASYAPTSRGSAQYLFVADDLKHVDRLRTPWLVVMYHTPWYNSNTHHYQEAYTNQQDLEDLFYKYGVDIVFNGHVHSYERSHPVYKNEVNPCGTVHVVIGDAGNLEGPALPWLEPQPNWSAVRESAFGSGLLTVYNDTHAEWAWHRAACAYKGASNGKHPWWFTSSGQGDADCSTEGDNSEQKSQSSDILMMIRDLKACPNRAQPLTTQSATGASLWSWVLIGSALCGAVILVGTMLILSALKPSKLTDGSGSDPDEDGLAEDERE